MAAFSVFREDEMPRSERNPRRSPAEWQAIIDRHATSGLSAPAFCKQQGIPYTSFLFGRRFARRSQQPKFVDVTPKAPGWDVEIALPNGIVLRFKG